MKQTLHLSKSQRIGVIFTLVLTKFALSSDFILYPLTNEIFSVFPNHAGLTNYIISGPTLLIMIMSLLLPSLLMRYTKRRLMIFGIFLFTIGGIFNIAIENVYWIAAARSMIGIGQGILSVLSITFLADLCTGTDQQARYIGILNACGNLAAMILSYFTGVLSGNGWKAPFVLYWFSVPMLLAAILFLPKSETADDSGAKNNQRKNKAKLSYRFKPEFYYLLFVFTAFSILRTIIMYYMSAYTAENQLGGSELTAQAASLSQLFAFSGAMLFSVLYKYLKNGIMPLTLAITSFAFLLWMLKPSPFTIYMVYCLVCGSSGCLMAYSYARPMQILPPDQTDAAISLLSAFGGISGFIPTYLVSGIMALSGFSSFTATIPFYTTAAILLLLSSLIFLLNKESRL